MKRSPSNKWVKCARTARPTRKGDAPLLAAYPRRWVADLGFRLKRALWFRPRRWRLQAEGLHPFTIGMQGFRGYTAGKVSEGRVVPTHGRRCQRVAGRIVTRKVFPPRQGERRRFSSRPFPAPNKALEPRLLSSPHGFMRVVSAAAHLYR